MSLKWQFSTFRDSLWLWCHGWSIYRSISLSLNCPYGLSAYCVSVHFSGGTQLRLQTTVRYARQPSHAWKCIIKRKCIFGQTVFQFWFAFVLQKASSSVRFSNTLHSLLLWGLFSSNLSRQTFVDFKVCLVLFSSNRKSIFFNRF